MPFPTFTKVWHNESYDAIRPSRTSLSAAGKTVFITGGNQGIGAATARAFAEAKASTIAITGRREHKLLETKNAIEAVRSSTRVVTFAIDVLDEEAMNTAFRLLGTVDVLVNNAGYLPDTKSIVESDVDDWWRGMEVNVKGAFIVTRAFIQVASEDAVIVNLTTAGSHLPPLRNFSGYNPGKLAANKFFEHVQAEHPQLRVYSLHPGVIESEMSKKSGPAFAKHEIVFKKDHESLPAETIVWLTSSEATFLKGRTIWANWDVEELKAETETIQAGLNLTTGLIGLPEKGLLTPF